MKTYDILVVGAGFAGATIARKKAEEGLKVLLVEKRNHIAGNMYECYDKNDVRIHLYGPHIFHTNNEKVFSFLKTFSDFFQYDHKVVGKIDGQLVPIPFNFKSLELLFEKEKANLIKKSLLEAFPGQSKVSILELINNDNLLIKEFGEYVYDKVFVNYTAKQWGIPVSEIDTSVINRVPVILGYDDRYFQDKIQYMPDKGFTNLFENMLSHDNIEIVLNTDVRNILKLDFENKKTYLYGIEFSKPIYYTGAIDELMNYEYGELPYRTLDLVFEQYDKEYFQSNSVINYPNEEDFTRITEFKYLTKQIIKNKTTILKEYPAQYDINDKKYSAPYYPISNENNIKQYDKYKQKLAELTNINLCGRLAEYKYYNMDVVIEKALNMCNMKGIK